MGSEETKKDREFTEEDAEAEIKRRFKRAEETIHDEKKTENLVKRTEAKIKHSKLGGMLDSIPLLLSMVKSYVKGEYREVPLGSIIAIVSALLYWVSPIDIIPDVIPGVGYVDDALVVAVCLKMIGSDLENYRKWLEDQEKES